MTFWPTSLISSVSEVLTTSMAGAGGVGTTTVDGGDSGGGVPPGGVPVAVAVLVTSPESTSSCVRV